jgi:DNA polymerase-3 subunit gamma/tau
MMSYLVLARKWRPQTFSEVIGQEHITETLKKAVEKQRLAHAYLFAGPRGCGKTTTARLLAKIINCERPNGAEPCNECSSCRAIIEGRHLDVIEIDGASNRGIDEIRDLREKISYTPAQGRFKIYIIDEVHMLTPQAFNALLKTLEEPPAHVYLIFATTEPHKVPATILSRCQRFNFKRLELREIVGQLEKICAEEKIARDREALVLLARRAEGSMRDGESLLDQCMAASEGTIDLPLVRRVLGLVDAPLITDLLRAIARRDRREAIAVVDRVVDAGLDLEEFFLAYVEGLRNLLILSIEGTGSVDYLDLTTGEIEELRALAAVLKTENVLFLFRSAARAYRELKASGQPRYQLEAAVAEAASWESAVEISDLIRRLEQPEGGGGGAGARKGTSEAKTGARAPRPDGTSPAGERARGAGSADDRTGRAATVDREKPAGDAAFMPEAESSSGGSPSPPPAASGAYARVDRSGFTTTEAADEEVSLRPLGGRENWERFLSQVRESKLTLGIWLMSARVRSVEGDRLVLAFSPQNRFAREMILEEKNRRYIEFHLERFFGRTLIVETDEQFEPPTAPARPVAEKARVSDPGLDKLVGDAPVIKRLVDELDGEIFSDGT